MRPHRDLRSWRLKRGHIGLKMVLTLYWTSSKVVSSNEKNGFEGVMVEGGNGGLIHQSSLSQNSKQTLAK